MRTDIQKSVQLWRPTELACFPRPDTRKVGTDEMFLQSSCHVHSLWTRVNKQLHFVINLVLILHTQIRDARTWL